MDLRWFRQNLFARVVLEAFTMHAVYRLNFLYDWKVSYCLGGLHGSAVVSAELACTSCAGSIYDACSVPLKLSI